MCGRRSERESTQINQVLTEFLVQLDGISSNNDGVFVLAATNRPSILDEAILRRFQKRIYIALPNKEARSNLLKNLKKNLTKHFDSADFDSLSERTNGFSGSDIKNLVDDAIK